MNEKQNTDIVKEIYAAFGRGDVNAILNTLANAFEWHHSGPSEIIPWAKSRTTKAEVADFFKELGGAVDVLAFEPRDYVAQADKVVALGLFRAKVKATGKTFEENWAMAWTFKNGKVVAYRAYDDTAAMVAAFRK